MKKEEVEKIIEEATRDTKFSLIYEHATEYFGSFHYGHFNAKLKDNLQYESRNQWLFDFKPGFGKGYTVLLEGEKIGALKQST